MKNEFTEGKILRPLLRFTFPVLAALILQTMYGAVDLLIVGQFGVAADVSAVSTGSQLMMAVTSVITGLSMGTTILLGQKIGEGDAEAAGRAVGNGIRLFALIGVILTGLLLVFSRPLAGVMQAPAEALSGTVTYIAVCGAGALFIVAYNVFGSVFRGMGDSRTPLIAVLIACVANVGLDLLFVGGLHMAVTGAALATVIAQGVSVLLSLLLIRRRGLPFSLTRGHLRRDGKTMARILRLGTPVALQDLLVSISFLVILAIVNTLGVVASAGVGIAEKLCGFIMLVPSAFMQSMSAFVAQNVGARRMDRARCALKYAMLVSFGVSVVMAYLAFFHGTMLAGIFSREQPVIQAAADYLRAYAIDTLIVPFLFCYCGYFNGCGCTTFVMMQGIIGSFCVRIPVSFGMSRMANATLFRIGLATPCSTVVQITLCTIYYIRTLRREKANDLRRA